MKTPELLPCPFCGGEASLLSPCRGPSEGGWEIHCFNDECGAMAGHEDKNDMITRWNKRQPSVGDGFVVVPREATAGMIGVCIPKKNGEELPDFGEPLRDIWTKMIAAAEGKTR